MYTERLTYDWYDSSDYTDFICVEFLGDVK